MSSSFTEIPRQRPETPLLNLVTVPEDLRRLTEDQLPALAHQLRAFLLYTVGQTGGHFGAGLGVVELTVALHYVFETPRDKLIWDVGHQTYPHKILTGRREDMSRLRRPGGPAPFPSRTESEYDVFGTGHSSTSISAALGLELASRVTGDSHATAVVIGDGAMTAGMAFEALNHLAASDADVLVILNDNAMSISENVGGLANYFARNISAGQSPDTDGRDTVVPGSIFRDLGFDYTGPVDGHNLPDLVESLRSLKSRRGPQLLHVLTRKGKGYAPAEAAPVDSHALTKLEKSSAAKDDPPLPGWSAVFGEWATRVADTDHRLVMITPAMKEGSGLGEFASRHPDRFHDVAIAEQHAATFAGGLAAGGAKPVLAIYSTFLQRAYDQLIHDIAIQDLDVLIAVDRASLLEDGPTHSGVFDLSFTRVIPNLSIMAPSSEASLKLMLQLGYEHPGPCVVRYPRGQVSRDHEPNAINWGKGRQVREGHEVVILSFGNLLSLGHDLAEARDYTLVDMQFIKPLDTALIDEVAATHRLIVTLEENAVAGGAGSAVGEYLNSRQTGAGSAELLHVGIPDRFMEHDEPAQMRAAAGLTAAEIETRIQERLQRSPNM